MTPNKLLSEALSVLGTLDPISAGPGAVTTPWVSVKNHIAFLALIQLGVLGAGATVDAKIQQATTVGGAGVKDIAGKAITQVLKATGDNKQVLINFKGQDLDTEGGFQFVRLSVTVGTAASIVGAVLLGGAPNYEPAQSFNQAAVAQIL
jgi:hypothetical protein